ncbi:hypothetical protein JAAARDRAFT_450738 [Jaapia argillacea MUCL 33604]|uniref:RING-type domain-containing protein n=1 Tax=Jaapia argillacea MUCL 33604 TaxID=933084 RepID=A0A067Q5A5_9AGAM|nr:hypothetical protein JAAARDRAFT_450738 [Jaapia argillacea MUCL 33604]
MGQSNSRNVPATPQESHRDGAASSPPVSPVADDRIALDHAERPTTDSTEPNPDNGITPAESSTTPKRTRSTKRRSLLNFVRPRTDSEASSFVSANSHGGSLASTLSKKRWKRRSRPADLVEDGEVRRDSAVEETESLRPPSMTRLASVKGKGKASEADSVLEEPSADADQVSATPAAQLPVASSSTSALDNSRLDRLSEESSQTNHDDSLIPESSSDPPPLSEPTEPTPPPLDLTPSLPDPPPTLPETPVTPTPQRHFPPAGTLVVVQGVVHTSEVPRPPPPSSTLAPPNTDASRGRLGTSPARPTRLSLDASSDRRSSSTPRSAATSRNRLSGLLRPPSMLSSSRRHSSEPNADSRGLAPAESSEESTATSTSTASTSSSLSEDHTATDTTPPSEGEPTTNGREVAVRHAPLSPGSIEVLGTLLSVAAAATAASLVTGSSEPLFNSGLALPTGATLSNNTQSPAPSDRPLSPTPTSGLGLGGGRNDRGHGMRSPWANLRERFGLNNPPNPRGGLLPGLGAGAPSNVPDDPSRPMDPRERMLRDMARALSMGLGLNGTRDGNNPTTNVADDGTGNEPSSRPSTDGRRGSADGGEESGNTSSEPQLPPEHSFERFLVDLQADLRIALSEEEEPRTAAEEDRQAPEPEVDEVPQASDDAGQTTEAAAPFVEATHTDASVATRTTSEVALQTDPMDEEDEDGDQPPALADLSDSEDEVEENDDDMHTAEEHPVPEVVIQTSSDDSLADPPTPVSPISPEPRRLPPNVDGHSARRPGGGINWWRLYRFPPMPAPHSPTTPTSTSSTPVGSPVTETSNSGLSPTEPGSPSESATPSETSSTPSSPTSPTDPNMNVIVPVIVVGLQSVNTDHGHDEQQHGHTDGPSPHDPASPTGDFGTTPSLDDMDGLQPPPYNNDTNGTPRGRTWQSRAVNALRGLRPGRRAASNGTLPTPGPGSRTFLIYVIGGYYPPNHHMVTGSDNLDSFEALLELAELLGQVKPPTVTKEEIEKSGLQIIKPSDLEQYEKDGRVASNCTDRCLICLDDYDHEDDLRLMSCKHAFHKTCVDKWLETGRNNCPACRSKGVPTDGDSPPPTPSPTAT